MANIHTLDPERRSSKEKELTNEMIELVKKYVDEIPLISFIGIIELVKIDAFQHQKDLYNE